MRRSDPYSTPARRRRIINDVAKSVLRQYCIAACYNVIRFRIETKASIVLQCIIRQFIARSKLKRLIFIKQTKAAVRIQSIWRMKLAKMLKVKLRRELRLRQATKLALSVQTLYRNRKERLHRIALMVARQLALQKKRNLASIEIQRVFRGFVGRKRFAGFVAARKAYHLKRRQAAIIIQSSMRRCLSIVVVSVRRSRKKLERTRLRLKLQRWRKHFQKHQLSVMVCQSVIRVFLAKRRVAAYRQLLAQMKLDKMSEIRPLSPYQIPLRRDPVPTKTMNIQVDLAAALLTEMVASGPRCVVAWCVENYILHYQAKEGYALGAVVEQVVHSVDSLLGGESTAAALSADVNDKVITLAKWNEGQVSDVPANCYLPEGWDKTCCGVEGSAVVSVHLLRGGVEIHVSVDNPLPAATAAPAPLVEYSMEERNRLVFDFRSRVDIPPVVTSSLIVIVLHSEASVASPDTNVDLLKYLKIERNEYKTLTTSSSGTPDVSAGTSTSSRAKVVKGIDEAKFRFKNALVQVTTAPPAPVPVEDSPLPPSPRSPSPPPPAEDTGGEIIVFDDELTDDDSLIEDLPPLVTSVRPQTATVVRIVLRDPTPPPPDLDHMARRIQFMLRRRLDLKNVAAEYIQAMFYHHHMLYRWQGLVKQVLGRAVKAVMAMQRMVRCHQARVVLFDLRRNYRYCPDFSLDEEVNWASFGMLTYSSSSDSKMNSASAPAPPPLVARSTTGVTSGGSKPRYGSSTSASSVAIFNPVGELLDLIQLPGPPPGCVLSCDPLIQLPPRCVGNDYGTDVGSNNTVGPFQHATSINAEVRHCVLRYAMPTRLLDSNVVASKDGMVDGYTILNNFISADSRERSERDDSSFADLVGCVFCNHDDGDWKKASDSLNQKAEVIIGIAPVYAAIAAKYR